MPKPINKQPKGKGRPKRPRRHRLELVEVKHAGKPPTIPTGPDPQSTEEYRKMVRLAITNAIAAGLMARPITAKPRVVDEFRVLKGQIHLAKPNRASGAKPFDEKKLQSLIAEENRKGNQILRIVLPRWMEGRRYGSMKGLKVVYEGDK